jgi:hypothetical protein
MLSVDCPGSDSWIGWEIKSSDDTVLRRVKARRRGAIQPAVRVLSVDDWAWRKKQRYGTMLMDCRTAWYRWNQLHDCDI